MSIALIPSRTDDAVAFLAERAQAQADAAADAEYDRRERIEKSVTFADLLEQLVELSEKDGAEFMACLAHGNKHDRYWLHCVLEQAKEEIVTRRLAQGE